MGEPRNAWMTASVRESQAYRSGWEDGRFGTPAFTLSSNRAIWSDLDRLAYYRGHREGRRVREMLGITSSLTSGDSA